MGAHRYEDVKVDPRYAEPIFYEFTCASGLKIRGSWRMAPSMDGMEWHSIRVPGMGVLAIGDTPRIREGSIRVRLEQPAVMDEDGEWCALEDGFADHVTDFGEKPDEARRLFQEVKEAMDARRVERVRLLRQRQGR